VLCNILCATLTLIPKIIPVCKFVPNPHEIFKLNPNGFSRIGSQNLGKFASKLVKFPFRTPPDPPKPSQNLFWGVGWIPRAQNRVEGLWDPFSAFEISQVHLCDAAKCNARPETPTNVWC